MDLEHLRGTTLKGALEALLLVSSDAVPATTLAQACGVAPSEAAEALADLAAEYADANRGFQLREVAGGWRLFTHPAYHDLVEAYVLSWDTRRLSQAALETLAVIAYHQPVTREGVRAVRGVNSDGVIASLREKGLVREVGHASDRGQAALWGTTQRFLEEFGLRSLRDLPPLEDFAPDEKSREFIRERLSGRAISSTLEETAEDIEDERDLLGEGEGEGDQEAKDGAALEGEAGGSAVEDDGASGGEDDPKDKGASAADGAVPADGEEARDDG